MPEQTPVDTSRYVVHMDPKYGPLEPIDVPALAATVDHDWFNQTLCQVNDSLIRIGVVHGEYHWHQHDQEDEFFYVVDGHLVIEIENHDDIDLLPGQGVTVPRGRQHRPIAPERTTILMIEQSGIQPTGD